MPYFQGNKIDYPYHDKKAAFDGREQRYAYPHFDKRDQAQVNVKQRRWQIDTQIGIGELFEVVFMEISMAAKFADTGNQQGNAHGDAQQQFRVF